MTGEEAYKKAGEVMAEFLYDVRQSISVGLQFATADAYLKGRKEERERCAKICLELNCPPEWIDATEACAKAIRDSRE